MHRCWFITVARMTKINAGDDDVNGATTSLRSRSAKRVAVKPRCETRGAQPLWLAGTKCAGVMTPPSK